MISAHSPSQRLQCGNSTAPFVTRNSLATLELNEQTTSGLTSPRMKHLALVGLFVLGVTPLAFAQSQDAPRPPARAHAPVRSVPPRQLPSQPQLRPPVPDGSAQSSLRSNQGRGVSPELGSDAQRNRSFGPRANGEEMPRVIPSNRGPRIGTTRPVIPTRPSLQQPNIPAGSAPAGNVRSGNERGDWRNRGDSTGNNESGNWRNRDDSSERNRDWRDRDGNDRDRDWRNRDRNGTDWRNRSEEWRRRHGHWDRCYHDRNWWRNNYTRFVLFGGGYYFWNSGYWYPAYGYDPYFSTYTYDAPIYGYNDLDPAQVIANVQAELERRGYYVGAIDGTYGPTMRRALLRFQSDNGLPVTGEIDEDTLASLGFE